MSELSKMQVSQIFHFVKEHFNCDSKGSGGVDCLCLNPGRRSQLGDLRH